MTTKPHERERRDESLRRFRKLTPLEFAQLQSVSRMTIYRLLQEGAIPGATKVRGQWRIPADALED